MDKIKKNIPNAITLSRMITSILAGTLFIAGNYPLAIVLYVYSAISDFLDGLAARKLNAFTKLGKKLDPISDKIFALSILVPSLVLGNYLMILPLILEGEITSTTIAAEKSNINIKTERVGKYKTWFLSLSLIIGLLATINPALYFLLAPLLGYTTHFQIQSLKAYKNQYNEKLNTINNNLDIKDNEIKETKENTNIKNRIKSHYDELIFYQNIEVSSKPKQLIKRK